jgi:hypothetical protein
MEPTSELGSWQSQTGSMISCWLEYLLLYPLACWLDRLFQESVYLEDLQTSFLIPSNCISISKIGRLSYRFCLSTTIYVLNGLYLSSILLLSSNLRDPSVHDLICQCCKLLEKNIRKGEHGRKAATALYY